mmetsp:Transcript_21459/g.47002  ORF Transcript_21459/g.47002 Transcript_21459/m.47002 type:complete len:502 (-) Transcript_21459:147-1652(-)
MQLVSLHHHHLVVLQVEAAVRHPAPRHHLCQVPQVDNRRAVEAQQLHVVDVLVAEGGVAGQDLAQHHQLLLPALGEVVVHAVQQAHRGLRAVLPPVLTLQVRLTRDREYQACRYEVRGVLVANVGGDKLTRLGQLDLQLHQLPAPQHRQLALVPHVLVGDEVRERDALPSPERHRAVTADLHAVKADEHVIGAQHTGRVRGGVHTAHQDTLAAGPHAVRPPQRLALHALPLYAQGREAAEAPGAHVVIEEVVDHGGGDHVAHVLHVFTHQRLERDADALSCAVKDGPTTVPPVDGGVNLDGQQVGAAVTVVRHLNAADHTRCHRDGVTAYRVPDHRHAVLQSGQGAKLQRHHSLPELSIIHIQQCNVAVNAYGHYTCEELAVVPPLLDLDLRVVVYAVCIGQQVRLALVHRHEAAAGGVHLPLALPGQGVVRLGVDGVHLDAAVHVLGQELLLCFLLHCNVLQSNLRWTLRGSASAMAIVIRGRLDRLSSPFRFTWSHLPG